MSGFKVGDEVFVVQRHRAGRIETIDRSTTGCLIYFVRFSEKDLFFYTDDDLLLKSDIGEKSEQATLKDLRELLLSDEFMTAFAKKFFSTPMPASIQSIDPASGSSFSLF